MKKILLTLSATMAIMLLASCDTKVCYCYNYSPSGVVTEETTYTGYDQMCAALSRGVEGAANSRVCVESNERMDPGSLASK